MDAHKNFAVSTVAVAPIPATSGTALTVASGDGTKFPAASFNAVVWPASSNPTTANAEVVRVTAIATDVFTITRTQESSSARTIIAGDQIAAAITAKSLTDIEAAALSGTVTSVSGSGGTTGLTLTGGAITTTGTLTLGGTLVVANGGTGAATLTAHGVLIGEGTSAVAITAAGTSRQLLVSGGASADPAWTTETFAVPSTAGNLMQSDGTNWTAVVGGWTTVKVAGSDFTTSSASLTDITGLSFSAVASTTYEIEAWLEATSSTTAGIQIGINSTGTSPTVVLMNGFSTGATAATSNGAMAQTMGNNQASATQITAGTNTALIRIWALVKSGTGSPTISIRILKVTSGTATVKIGSKMEYRIQ